MDSFLECSIKSDESCGENINHVSEEENKDRISDKEDSISRRVFRIRSSRRVIIESSDGQGSDEEDDYRVVKSRRRGSRVKGDDKRKFPCDLCTYSSTRPADLRRHFLKLHMNPSKEKKKGKEKRHLDDDNEEVPDGKVKHSTVVKGRKRGPKMKYVYDKTFPCNLCTYKSTRKFDLKRHIASVHNKEKPYVCDVCNYSTGLAETLKQHMLKVHNEMKFKCADCNVSCLNQTEYTKHLMERHDYHPHRCNVCPFSCTTYLALKRHIMKIHKDLRPFRCSLCDYSTCHRGNLVKHVNESHSTDTVHRCDLCNFATKNGKYELSLHKKNEHKKKKEKRPKKKNKMEDNDQHIFDVILQSNNLAFINSQLETNNIPILTSPLGGMSVSLSQTKTTPIVDLTPDQENQIRDPNLNYCDFCVFKSQSKLDLECHLVDFHSLDKTFVCVKCSFTTPRKFNFKNHLKFKHGLADEDLESVAVQSMKCENVKKRPSSDSDTPADLIVQTTQTIATDEPDKMVVEDHFLLGQTLGPIPPSSCQPVQNQMQ